MTVSKERNLVVAAMSYAIDCLSEGDTSRLHALGLGKEDAAQLGGLTLKDLRQVGALCAHGLTIQFDPNIVRAVIGRLRSAREEEAMQRALIAADAPRAMMRDLYGMGTREYARLREMLGVATGVGRPADLDEASEHRLWHALTGRLGPDPERPLEPVVYLEVHSETGAPLRAIWSCARRWAAQRKAVAGNP